MAAIVLFGIFYPLKTHGDKSEAVKEPITPLSSLSDTSDKDTIIEAVRYVAQKYLIDEGSFMQTIKCESGFQHAGVFGDWNGNEYLAYGIGQFHKPTFYAFCKGSYYSIKDQLVCMAQMFKDGRMFHWTCWKRYFST